MIRYLTTDEIRKVAVSVTRSQSVVRDENLLASAAGRPRHSFDGHEVYPDVWSKAAALIEGVARNHALIDGNKRTAWTCGWIFLRANGISVQEVSTDRAEDFMLNVATGFYENDNKQMTDHLKALFGF